VTSVTFALHGALSEFGSRQSSKRCRGGQRVLGYVRAESG
jgi:hypothetical protein